MCLKCPLLTVTLAQWCSLSVEVDISASCVSFGALDSGRQSYILKHSETQHSKRPVNAGLLQSGTNRVGSVFAKSRHVTWTSTGQEGVDYDDDDDEMEILLILEIITTTIVTIAITTIVITKHEIF